MGQHQTTFLKLFENAFCNKFKDGVFLKERTGFKKNNNQTRRDGIQINEKFEIGDLRIELKDFTIILEYDGKQISLSNLIKFWPFITNDLEIEPKSTVIFCTFSSWASWGLYRDLWDWSVEKIATDTNRKVEVKYQQFDNGRKGDSLDLNVQEENIKNALEWIDSLIKK